MDHGVRRTKQNMKMCCGSHQGRGENTHISVRSMKYSTTKQTQARGGVYICEPAVVDTPCSGVGIYLPREGAEKNAAITHKTPGTFETISGREKQNEAEFEQRPAKPRSRQAGPTILSLESWCKTRKSWGAEYCRTLAILISQVRLTCRFIARVESTAASYGEDV